LLYTVFVKHLTLASAVLIYGN